MRFRTVLFDLDGTLIDSCAMILSSFRHATRTVLRRDVPEAELLAHVGVGSHLHEQMRGFDAERVGELVRVYREHNVPLHGDLQPCAGVLDVIGRLRREGRSLGIVTAKHHATVRLAFGALPLEPFFDVVVAAEDTEHHKPDPAGILLALERLGSRSEDAAYVGDAPFDVAAARAAGVYAVAVTWGGLHSRERVAAEGPDAVVDDPEDLYALL
jgi:pyrophosphatase PpaX